MSSVRTPTMADVNGRTKAEARIQELEAENFKLAANQCEGPQVGDEHGNFKCARVNLLEHENRVLRHNQEYYLKRIKEFENRMNKSQEDRALEGMATISVLTARIVELEAEVKRLGKTGAERYWEARWRDEADRVHWLEERLEEMHNEARERDEKADQR